MKARVQTVAIVSLFGLPACPGAEAGRVEGPAPARFGTPELVYSRTRMAYEFRTDAEARAYEADTIYKKAPLAGVDVDRRGNVYVTTPR